MVIGSGFRVQRLPAVEPVHHVGHNPEFLTNPFGDNIYEKKQSRL